MILVPNGMPIAGSANASVGRGMMRNVGAIQAAMFGGGSGRIPSQYEEVDGVYSDGFACTALNHVHTNNVVGKVDVDFIVLGLPTTSLLSKNIFGCSTSDKKWLLNNYLNITYESELYCGTGYIMYQLITDVENVRYSLVYERYNSNYSINGSDSTSRLINVRGTCGSTMTLGRIGVFTQNDAGQGNGFRPISGRTPKDVVIRKFDYYDGGVLSGSLVPCVVKSTGEAGFYDLVDKSFVGNLASSGEFHAYR